MTNDFLQKRHESFATPENIVFDLVQKATGTEPVSREKIVRGYDNEVYLVRTSQDREFIVRIRRHGEVEFRQEAWAMEQCKKAGVPVPEIFMVGNVPIQNETLEVMILGKLSGQSLAALREKIEEKELRKILVEAGQILKKIHSIKVGGFYQRHEEEIWDFPDWDSVMNSSIRGRSAEKDFIISGGFSEEDFTFMIETMEKHKRQFPCKEPVLNHGDYLPEHIFVGPDMKISGIIDFGMFQGAPRIHDIAYLNFEEPNLDLKAIKEGYGGREIFGESFDLQLNMYKLMLQIGHLAHNVKIGNTIQAKTISSELRKTLAFLRS